MPLEKQKQPSCSKVAVRMSRYKFLTVTQFACWKQSEWAREWEREKFGKQQARCWGASRAQAATITMCALPHTQTHTLTHTTHTSTYTHTTLALFANFVSVFCLFVCLFAHFMLSYAHINKRKQKAQWVTLYIYICVCVYIPTNVGERLSSNNSSSTFYNF